MSEPKRFRRAGVVARCRPVTLVHQALLEAICEMAEHVIIGIGSPNLYDARNPFTAKETEDMIRLSLGELANYEIICVPDYGNGPLWRENTKRLFGELDAFVTGNEYVQKLFEHDYQIISPADIIPEDRKMPISGTVAREAMAMGLDWRAMVPKQVADYLDEKGLVKRFVKEFGLETIALRGSYVIQQRKVDTHG